MKLHRFIGDFDLSSNNTEIINMEHIKQIRSVLRMEAGDFLILSDGKGNEVEAKIFEISTNKMAIRLWVLNYSLIKQIINTV